MSRPTGPGREGLHNILFIHAESMDGRKMGCMGHAATRGATPNLDSLARSGVIFDNAYSNCPVCNPSRASMWSGKYPHYYQSWNNHEGLREGVPTFRTTFDRAGYLTGAIGPLDYMQGKHSIRDRIGSWTRSAIIQRPISRTPLPRVVEDEIPYASDWRRTYQAIDWLREAASDSRPFLLYLTTSLVHPSFTAQRRHVELIDENKIEIPPGLRSIDETDHPVVRYMRIAKNCKNRFSEDLARQIRHVYFAMIANLDEMIGRVVRSLEDLGLMESTYIIFSSDHGEMAAEQNQILKRSMFEPSIHEPLIVSGPGIRSNARVSEPVSLIDIYPTLLDMGRLNYDDYRRHPGYPQSLDGESLMPLLRGEEADRRDWAYAEYNGDRCCTGTFMIRKGNWKYVKYIGYAPQLFDLEEDPWEDNDLSTQRHEIVEEMDGLLMSNFDCGAIDAAAKAYDRRSFAEWRARAIANQTYRQTMSRVYSGYDNPSVEEMAPWTDEEERIIETWLAKGPG